MSNGKILIVDDEKNIRLALTAALETLPVEVEAVASGAEALEKLEKQPYGFKLWLLDLLMPGIDGMEVLRRLAASRPHARVATARATRSAAMTRTAPAREPPSWWSPPTGARTFRRRAGSASPRRAPATSSAVATGPPTG